ncbi:MAG TPA: RnfABCDGE type electron transport complex subunit G [Candidatus Cloacimonetes bacterium]|nr:RnfABCDGE type electron transport complex subunit G [Candidatus Cloacimonadota bacterium]
MKEIIRPALILLIICVIASVILAIIYKQTAPLIAQNKLMAEEQARKTVLPEAAVFKPVIENDQILYYEGFDTDSSLVGYVFSCFQYGYSSDVKTMVGLTTNLKISAITVVSQMETPGLGANCTKLGFLNQFSGKDPAEIYVDKDGGDIQSLTGATITSRAVTNAIRDTFLKIRDKL